MYTDISFFIGGTWVKASGSQSGKIYDPATGDELGTYPIAEVADIDKAATCALEAFASWRATSALERGNFLRTAAALLRKRAEHIGKILCMEEGKRLEEAKQEVMMAASTFEWDAERARHEFGTIIPGAFPNIRHMTVHEPIGPIAAFTPWNFPAMTPARKISAALAAGCTIVLKASEETPGTAVEIVRACADAGIPAGVINLIFGDPAEVSTRLIESGIIRKITFTGSSLVGQLLAGQAAKRLLPSTLELGGHAPVIVAADADPVFAARTVSAAKFQRNAGQVCTSPTRMFVHEKVHKKFSDELTKIAGSLVVGNGLDPATQMGPLANERRISAMEDIIGDAKAHGSKITTGGNRIKRLGYFWEPTVLTDVPKDAKILFEEPFGPVAPIVSFTDLDEALAMANATSYGLAGYVFTNDIETSRQLSAGLEVGIVSVNTVIAAFPETSFGGVKFSGYGREGGLDSIKDFLITKAINEALAP